LKLFLALCSLTGSDPQQKLEKQALFKDYATRTWTRTQNSFLRIRTGTRTNIPAQTRPSKLAHTLTNDPTRPGPILIKCSLCHYVTCINHGYKTIWNHKHDQLNVSLCKISLIINNVQASSQRDFILVQRAFPISQFRGTLLCRQMRPHLHNSSPHRRETGLCVMSSQEWKLFLVVVSKRQQTAASGWTFKNLVHCTDIGRTVSSIVGGMQFPLGSHVGWFAISSAADCEAQMSHEYTRPGLPCPVIWSYRYRSNHLLHSLTQTSQTSDQTGHEPL